MSDPRHDSSSHGDVPRRPGEVHTADSVQYDRDLNVRGITWTAIWLTVGTLATMLVSWWIYLGLAWLERRSDPPMPPMHELQAIRKLPQPPMPAGPLLQADADQDMRELRASEDRMLLRPSWIDEKQGAVRLPIDLAIDVLLRKGLPKVETMPAQATPPAAAPNQATTGVPGPAVANAPSTPAPAPTPSGGAR